MCPGTSCEYISLSLPTPDLASLYTVQYVNLLSFKTCLGDIVAVKNFHKKLSVYY